MRTGGLMKGLLISLLTLVPLFSSFTQSLCAQALPSPQLTLRATPEGKFFVRWHAASGLTRLVSIDTLQAIPVWHPLAGALPLADDFWEKEIFTTNAQAFFAPAA